MIDRMYPSKRYTLDEEIESWKGFPWALRKEDVEVWDGMIRGAREYEYAIKKSGRWLTTEPYFMAMLLLQYIPAFCAACLSTLFTSTSPRGLSLLL